MAARNMKNLPAPLRVLLLVAILPTTIHALPPTDRNLFARAPADDDDQNVCAAAGLDSCGGGLPDNFCCRTNTHCIVLAGRTTGLCCPLGSDCDKIVPITCNLRKMDPSETLDGELKSTVLEGAVLPPCGRDGFCCPFGYSCAKDGNCSRNADQSIAPAGAAGADSGSAKPSSSSQPPSATSSSADADGGSSSSEKGSSPTDKAGGGGGGSGSPDPSQKQTEDDGTNHHPKSFPTAQVVGGVVAGVVALILLVGGIMFYKSRRNRNHHGGAAAAGMRPKSSGASTASSESWGNKIVVSQPILDASSGHPLGRTDFLLHKRPGSSGATTSTTTRAERLSQMQRPQSVDLGNRGGGGGTTVPPIRGMNLGYGAGAAHHNKPRLQRGPSQESIQIALEGPFDRRATNATTFTDLLVASDMPRVHQGSPYINHHQSPPTPPRR